MGMVEWLPERCPRVALCDAELDHAGRACSRAGSSMAAKCRVTSPKGRSRHPLAPVPAEEPGHPAGAAGSGRCSGGGFASGQCWRAAWRRGPGIISPADWNQPALAWDTNAGLPRNLVIRAARSAIPVRKKAASLRPLEGSAAKLKTIAVSVTPKDVPRPRLILRMPEASPASAGGALVNDGGVIGRGEGSQAESYQPQLDQQR